MSKATLDFLEANELQLSKIAKVERIKHQPVYDISLPSNIPLSHSFIANGFVTHNSLSPIYFENMLKTFGLDLTSEEVFGSRNTKTQKWEIKPIVRVYNEVIGEKFFDYLSRLERALPDKRLIKDQWYYSYEDTKANRKLLAGKYDVNYAKKMGSLLIEAEDGKLQALILVDSYPAMLPKKQDVDDPNSSIAVQARMFSDQLKRVKGRMRAKRIAVLGVNQLRKVPMAMYGPSESEPGGTALSYYSDCRLKATPRSLSGVPVNGFKGKGMIMEEDSVTTEGVDQYRFIHVKAIKNKLSQPYYETWLRLWIEDSTGEARGFDPVFDTFFYLKETGQLKGDGKKITLELHKGPTFKSTLTWYAFKTLVLGSNKQIKEVCSKVGASKAFKLRDWCKKQMLSDTGLELYMANKKAVRKSKAEVENEDAEDDE